MQLYGPIVQIFKKSANPCRASLSEQDADYLSSLCDSLQIAGIFNLS